MFLHWISSDPKLDKCHETGLKLPALQLSEQTGKGQSAGLSDQCLLHRSDLSTIDSLSLWRGVDGLKVLPKGVEEEWEEEKSKRRGWRLKVEAEVVVEVTSCLLSWLHLELRGGPDLCEVSNRLFSICAAASFWPLTVDVEEWKMPLRWVVVMDRSCCYAF